MEKEKQFINQEKGTPRDYTEKKEFWERDEKKIQSDFLCRPYVFELTGDPKNKTMADIGCGEGYVSRCLASMGAEKVFGIDTSKGLIKSAKEKEQKENKGIEYAVGSATELPFEEGQIDCAVSVLVYGHFDSQQIDQANSEVARVLKENGEFILAVPHPFYYVGKPKSKWADFDKETPDYWKENQDITLRTADKNEFPITAKNHTFSGYMNSLIKNGFMVEEIVEPKPTEEDLKKYQDMWGEEDKLPTYLIIKSKKICNNPK